MRNSPLPGMETKSLFCRSKRNKKAFLLPSKNRDEKKARKDSKFSCDQWTNTQSKGRYKYSFFCYSKLVTVVEGDQKAAFSIATTPRCRRECYSFL